ncbi:hypothetical protein Tco_0066524 [Tanacetum coccineum]
MPEKGLQRLYKYEPETYSRNLLRYLKELDKLLDERVLKYGELRMKEREVQAIKETEKRLKESEMHTRESLVSEGATLEASLVIEARLVTKGITLDENLVAQQCTVDSTTSSELQNESNGSKNESSSLKNDKDDDIGPSYDSDTISEVPHDMFENVFAHGIQNLEQPESIFDTYVVNENNSDITSHIPNMDPDRGKEEHDYVDYEQQRAFFASLINNLKCDVEKCNEVNREAHQIKLLNDEISNLKSQVCQNNKTFAKENGKFDERQCLHEKQGLGFENKNDVENSSLLSKAKELAPWLYNIDEMGQDSLSDHKIISEEELKCEAEKRLKVKQRKSPLSYHGFVYGETQFKEPPKVPLKRRNVNLKKHLEQTANLKKHLEQAQLSNYDPKL